MNVITSEENRTELSGPILRNLAANRGRPIDHHPEPPHGEEYGTSSESRARAKLAGASGLAHIVWRRRATLLLHAATEARTRPIAVLCDASFSAALSS